MSEDNTTEAADLLAQFAREFEEVTDLIPQYEDDFEAAALALCAHLADEPPQPLELRRQRFIAHVNWKFRINAPRLKRFYALAARQGVTFNYHQKNEVQLAFDSSRRDNLESVLERSVAHSTTAARLLSAFDPVDPEETMNVLRSECDDPSRLRRPRGKRNIEREILQSQFGAFLFCARDERRMHEYFDPRFEPDTYRDNFWEQLHARSPELFNRDHALYIARVDSRLLGDREDYDCLRDSVCAWVETSYEKLNNHSYLALVINPLRLRGRHVSRQLNSDTKGL